MPKINTLALAAAFALVLPAYAQAPAPAAVAVVPASPQLPIVFAADEPDACPLHWSNIVSSAPEHGYTLKPLSAEDRATFTANWNRIAPASHDTFDDIETGTNGDAWFVFLVRAGCVVKAQRVTFSLIQNMTTPGYVHEDGTHPGQDATPGLTPSRFVPGFRNAI